MDDDKTQQDEGATDNGPLHDQADDQARHDVSEEPAEQPQAREESAEGGEKEKGKKP